MKTFKFKLTKFLRLIEGMDWEYIIPYLFIQYKYKTTIDKTIALRHINFAFIERKFDQLLNKYKDLHDDSHVNNGPVWVCWMQGEDSMPEIVQVCYRQLRKMLPANRKLILITWDNVRQYTDIPEYIYEKLQKGIITFTHFSDIIRFSVLSIHGGLWVDSTVYVASQIPESTFNRPYFSVRTAYNAESELKYNGVNRCLWKCFILGAVSESIWFKCAKEMIYKYWENNDFLLAYMLVDYILISIYDCNGNVRQDVESGVEQIDYLYSFEKLANEPYNEDEFHKMTISNRWFKLSYKLPFKTHTSDGQITYYGKLINVKEE